MARVLLSIAALVVLYVAVPVAGKAGAGAIAGLVLGLIVLGVVLFVQLRGILDAKHPGLRAAEALAVAVPLLIIVFAFTYLSVWRADHASFSEPLDHVSAVYFTVTVISTVGFGDITARTDATRLLVTSQILLDLVLVVGIARAFVFAAKIGVQRRQDEQASEP